MWSLEGPDTGRGRAYVVVIDETAMVSNLEQAWQQSIRPTLSDTADCQWQGQSDGERLMQMYRALGLQLQRVDNTLESGILNVRQRMQSGRLKVFASLSKYLEEYRCCRRNDLGQVNENHALQDAA